MRGIIIEDAVENNLDHVSLKIPHYQLVVVCGVSGSGKTSLVYDVLYAEGRRLFQENFEKGKNSGLKLAAPKAARIEGLFPVISIGQMSIHRSHRSTVGTMTGLNDFLRLLYARLGKTDRKDIRISRSLFSFNLSEGCCPACKGLGVQDHIDPELLIGDASRTIREGAFVLTTPNNYIVYSQVTMDVLDQVCRAEGFSVDIPWNQLSNAQQNIVLYGSGKIKVLFGKHPLESRLKWSGITAKPREEEYYKGIVPVMEDILKRDRNDNILRFARTLGCDACQGTRLNDNARSVSLWGKPITDFFAMNIQELHVFMSSLEPEGEERDLVMPVKEEMMRRTSLLCKLGCGHLALNRDSVGLSGGEGQRIRLSNQVSGGLRNVLYILDEPSIGLHPSEQEDLLDVLRTLVNSGNTVILVDHDEHSIRAADWIIDIGPGAGAAGGKILYNGPAELFFKEPQPLSITRQFLDFDKRIPQEQKEISRSFFTIEDASLHNLKSISPRILLQAFNVITGVSGSGKTSLVQYMMDTSLSKQSGNSDLFKKIIHLDASPIGRTPNSNPATYTGISDHVRDIFAALPESKQRHYKKGQFSFVVKGGRCESCGGAGIQEIGMHFMGKVAVSCEVCNGKRFTEETLEIRYQGKNIADILELTLADAHHFFGDQPKITRITALLLELGLGYLRLGQPSSTLSGGEAQRVKLAYELSRTAAMNTLYILDEPTTGLHMADVQVLLRALRKLVSRGNTLLCIEHDPQFILNADWIIDLGPGSGSAGGSLVTEGFVAEVLEHPQSITARFLRNGSLTPLRFAPPAEQADLQIIQDPIRFTGVTTHNLQIPEVLFPVDAITVITGVSGSGKSSLAYSTFFAESQHRFYEHLSFYQRQNAPKSGTPVFEQVTGLMPAVSLQKKNPVRNPRSMIATYTGLYDRYRLLFSRLATSAMDLPRPLSTAFSFNSEEGACPRCRGIGSLTVCNPDALVTNPEKSLLQGAMHGTKTGSFYGDPYGQFVATLKAVGKDYGIDFSVPYQHLTAEARKLAMEGCGNREFDVDWEYQRGNHTGIHHLKTIWKGFAGLVEEEYLRKHQDARAEAMLPVMMQQCCPDCRGYRLKSGILSFTIGGKHIGELNAMTVEEAAEWFSHDFLPLFSNALESATARLVRDSVLSILNALDQAGLGYLTTDRLTGSLSGGEFQRLQLAGLMKAPLTGIAYILDEPSFGLHPKDIQRILNLVMQLKQMDNTIIMVDHCPDIIRQADHVLRLGPGAGTRGGKLLFTGSGQEYLFPDIQISPYRFKAETERIPIEIKGAYANNLQQIDLKIPAGLMTSITGVSGSGKTSILEQVLQASIRAGHPVNCREITGLEQFVQTFFIEQSVPLSNSALEVGDKTGMYKWIAQVYSNLPEARQDKRKAAFFMPYDKNSRCPVCEGSGIHQLSLDFSADIQSACESCGGSGFKDEALQYFVDRKTIVDLFQLDFDALEGFLMAHLPEKHREEAGKVYSLIRKTGLSHLSARRSLNTLSGGEMQRLKLVLALTELKGPDNLILLDEPTGGLHPEDTRSLLLLFNEIIAEGNTVVCVTHEPLVMSASAIIVELGPGGGSRGGRIVQYSENC